MKDSFTSFLGIAKKAGKCIEGYNKCEEYIKKGNCYLLLISTEAAENTKDKFTSLCDARDIPLIVHYSKEELSSALGRQGLNVVGISDYSISKRLMELWNDKNKN